MSIYFEILILTIFFSLLINLIFIFNKTVYTLVTSVFIFLFVCGFILYLDFEFLAIAFAMIYVGGIAVMFLFLILIIDVKVENTKNLFFTNSSFFSLVFLTSFFSFIISFLVLYIYDPYSFNNILLFETFQSSFFNTSLSKIFFDQSVISCFYYICDFNFSDIFILGVYFYKYNSILLLFIALYLFIATIVAIFLCTSIFETNF